jgi:hypothetical protein
LVTIYLLVTAMNNKNNIWSPQKVDLAGSVGFMQVNPRETDVR